MATLNDPRFGFCRDCLAGPDVRGTALPCLRQPPSVAPSGTLSVSASPMWTATPFMPRSRSATIRNLRDKPVIIGGGKRGVVSTACYVARIHGVSSAMPMFKALEACPHAVVIKPDMEKYVRVGREIRQMMRDLTPLVEPLSIDEAFLDLSGTERLHHDPPARVMAQFSQPCQNGDRHFHLGRHFLLQVPRQDRLRLRKAARFFHYRRGRSRRLPGRQTGDDDLGRRQGIRRDAGKRWHPHHRPTADDGTSPLMAAMARWANGFTACRADSIRARVHPKARAKAFRRKRPSIEDIAS